MTRPIIVFDLDGTLVDTAPDLLDSLNHALSRGGVDGIDHHAYRRHAGLGGRVMIEKAFQAARRDLPPDLLADLVAAFLEHYAAGIPGRSALFPGALDAMERLSGAGYALAMCTNKPEALAVGLMRAMALEDRFAAICGAETFPFRKPDPRHLVETIRSAGADVGQALMVGDSRTDIDTAKAAGIPVVAVDFGYTDLHVREFEPTLVISHFDELTPDLAARLIRSAAG